LIFCMFVFHANINTGVALLDRHSASVRFRVAMHTDQS
jgi:hypothetical protein